ncbi:MAG: ribonucleoside-diphosphate reductase subunit alpha [Candidatus Sumerlaeaceae bacterium]|nr:ribonucleoside-diphosphate reductase subunit alpha [Candidatus Sumerlaeaceae bacterium]
MIRQIIQKLNGVLVRFDESKIRRAIGKAAAATESGKNPRVLDEIADHVVHEVERRFEDSTPDVESIQDIVERGLMQFGLFDEAKAYILYRAERQRQREIAQLELIRRVEASQLSIRNRTGARQRLDAKWLYDLFAKSAKGFERVVNVEALVERCAASLYEDMPFEEVLKAAVYTARALVEKDPAYSHVAARLMLESIYDEVAEDVSETDAAARYRAAFVSNVRSAVAAGRLDPLLLEFDLEKMAAAMDLSRDHLLDYMGLQTLYDRYFLRVEGGERRLEAPQGFWMRVSMGLAQLEGENHEARAREFYDVISTMRYVPSTPTLFHAGTTYPQLSSCYLNTVEDDLNHIFKVYSDNAQLSKYSGGIGTDWTNIRGTGALIKTTNVPSQGVVPFLKIANDVTVAINRSGKRRGAACCYLETWHYDIEDFLDLRKNTGDERRRTHDMNTANWIPDLFMKRVVADEDWTLFSPNDTPDLHHLYGRAFENRYCEYERKVRTGEITVCKTIPARTLWRKMITMLFETGHPWLTFKDPCNVRSPQDHAGVIHCSNLCTEITLNTSREETAVCNLGSINLGKHIRGGQMDFDLLQTTARVAMRILDNVIDLNFYPTDEAKTSNMKHRPVGLGIMGFQDALYLQGIDFESEAAVEFADASMEFISYYAIQTSSELAAERGAYESYKGSKWDRGIFPVDTLDLLEEERGMPIDVSRGGRLDWAPVRESVSRHGMRNSNCMAIAPTATISNISGCLPCIEPIYKNLYVKSNMSGEFTIINRYLVDELKARGLWNEDMIDSLKRSDGSVQEIDEIPMDLRRRFKEAFEIDPSWLIRMAAVRGKWIDQSQSLNIFMQGTSGPKLSETYLAAWQAGLKTTYYLRSMAASSIEKSTMDLRKGEQGVSRSAAPVAEASVPAPLPSACRINDPDCEACQ